jgi:Zinc-binding dehydrogenase.
MKRIVGINRQVKIIDDEMPSIKGKPSYILVKTMYSAISPGTELSMLGESGGETVHLGYSAMGKVVEVGEAITDVRVGDLVACYGAPYVHHDEYLAVPKTLYAKIPEGLDPKEAALGGLGAIAIHALRIANLQFGEIAVVVGLGILGQLIAKIGNAAAYNVIALDVQKARVEMLKEEGIKAFSDQKEMEAALSEESRGFGADSVLLCIGGKRSPLTHVALDWIRKGGNVVIVGDVEPDFPREMMFIKEARLFISRAGGPGRYDPVFEREAIDYPYQYVRWTEGRNLAEYLRLVKEGKIDVKPFITDVIDYREAPFEFEKLKEKSSAVLTKLIRFSNE